MDDLLKKIYDYSLEEIMGDRFGRYCKTIIQDRAIPDVRDGLKPVQRRILFSMHKEKNTYDKPYRKSARAVGDIMGKYHPHGDSSIYDAMVRMSQYWKVKTPYIDMHGNNGSIDNDPAAAMRYTEARLSTVSALLLQDIDQETVLFTPNFDDSDHEPTVLPAQYPNLLVNGTTGISAGYATNIPPHNINEIVDATIYRIQNPKCDLNDILKIVKGPDFPTGGIVQGKAGIKDAFSTGKGRIIIRSKTEIIETKTINQLVITEIPYEVVKSNLVKQIDDIRLGKDAQGILDVRDESDRNGLRIVIDIKKEQDANLIFNYLLKKTSLQVSYTYNVVAIVNKRPVQLGLLAMLDAYISFRQEVVLNRSKYQLSKIQSRCHILDGLIKAVSIMDDIIAIIRHSSDKGDAKKRLIETYDFSEQQAEAIVTLRLYRLTSTDVYQLKEEYAQLVNQMELLKAIINDGAILNQLLIKEFKDVKNNFVMKRLTEIQDDVEEIIIDKQSMIVNERVMLTVSRDGYVKRVSLRSFNASDTTLTGIKDSDELIGFIETDILDNLLLITSGGNYLYLPIYEIDDAKWRDVGSHLNSLANINGDKIVDAYTVKTLQTEAWILTLSSKGMIKRTLLNDLNTQRFNRTYNLMSLSKDDAVVSSTIVYKDEEVILATKSGYAVRYALDQIPITSLKAKGVKAINLTVNDTMIAMASINDRTDTLVIINDKAGLKRIKIKDFNNNNRPVKGDTLFTRKKSNPVFIRYLIATQTYDELTFVNDQVEKVISKDITMMSKDSTFSNPLSLKDNWYLLSGIQEIKVIDLPLDEITKNDADKKENDDNYREDYEFISLNV